MKWNKLKSSRKITTSVLAIFFILVIAMGTLFVAKTLMSGKIRPGTIIAGIDLSNKKPEDAIKTLESAKESYLAKEIEISLDGKTEKIKTNKLGINILTQETVEIIEAINPYKTSVFDLVFAENQKIEISLITKISDEDLLKTIKETFNINELETKNAEYFFNEAGELDIKEEINGKKINIEKLIKDIKENAENFKIEDLEIELIDDTAEITKASLEVEKVDVLEKLNNELALVDPIYSDDWFIKLYEKQDWVVFEGTEIKIKEDKLNVYIDEEISKWLDLPAEPVKIFKNEEGKIKIEGRGNNGKTIQRDLFKKGIELAIANKAKEIVIPIKTIEPEIQISDEIKAMGITDRIAVGHTSFYGSTANRLHNITVGSSQFNGVIVAPDEVFSFNETLGIVDGSTGYRKELVIKPEGTKPEYGGGICQVSTTMYRTILYSGLPIVERHPHSYAVSYYSQVLGHGLDATIYLGGPDLKFKNDTGNNILIQTYLQNDYELYFVFYGTPTGKTVELEGPYLSGYHNPGATIYIDTTDLAPGQTKQVEQRHTGFTALWYRHITDDKGKTTVETLNTNYKAIPAKILRGVGSETTSQE